MGDLTANFSKSEFACKCGQCGGLADMRPQFIQMLQEAREDAGTSFRITSGFRCPLHPETIKRPTSSHTIGVAVDIATPNSQVRYGILAALIGRRFHRIGIGKTFIHVDDDPTKVAGVCWDYYPKE